MLNLARQITFAQALEFAVISFLFALSAVFVSVLA